MEAVKDVISYISKEWAVVGSAPVTFVTVVVLVGVGIWFLTRWVQSGEIAGLKATIDAQDRRIALFKERLEHSQERLAELEREIEKTNEAISPADSVARQHSLAASAIASDIRDDLEKQQMRFLCPHILLPPVPLGQCGLKEWTTQRGLKKTMRTNRTKPPK